MGPRFILLSAEIARRKVCRLQAGGYLPYMALAREQRQAGPTDTTKRDTKCAKWAGGARAQTTQDD